MAQVRHRAEAMTREQLIAAWRFHFFAARVYSEEYAKH